MSGAHGSTVSRLFVPGDSRMHRLSPEAKLVAVVAVVVVIAMTPTRNGGVRSLCIRGMGHYCDHQNWLVDLPEAFISGYPVRHVCSDCAVYWGRRVGTCLASRYRSTDCGQRGTSLRKRD